VTLIFYANITFSNVFCYNYRRATVQGQLTVQRI